MDYADFGQNKLNRVPLAGSYKEPPKELYSESELTEGQKRLNKRIEEKQNTIKKNRIAQDNERKEREIQLKAKTNGFYDKLITENTDVLVEILSDIKIRNRRDHMRAIAVISFSDGFIKLVYKSRLELLDANVNDNLSCSSNFTLYEQRLVAEKICDHIVGEYNIEAEVVSSRCKTTYFVYIFNR